VFQNLAALQVVCMLNYADCRFTYTARVCPYTLLFLSSQLPIRFIIYVRYLEVYNKIRGVNLILVPMPSVRGKPMN